jgi:hypothetical protein
MDGKSEESKSSGLVIYDKTGGDKASLKVGEKLSELNEVLEKIPQAEALPPDTRETSHFVSISPASIQISKKEPSRIKSANYQVRKAITGWSPKSRSNMVARFLSLDYEPLFGDKTRTPAMITLTYPKDWETVVPNGQTFKRHVQALLKRFEAAYGERLAGLWKMEFQRRGAPHLHILTSLKSDLPGFREWFSYNWADVVNHPNQTERIKHEAAGTRIDEWKDLETFKAYLIAVYFSKHSSPSTSSVKNYQNKAPELWVEAGNIGRFWGYWGLSPAVAKAQISEKDAIYIKRILRRWHQAKGITEKVRVRRTNMKTGEIKYRWATRRQKRMSGKGGYLSVPDGVAMGELIALALENRTSPVLEQGKQVGNLSVLSLDSGIGNSELGVSFRDLGEQVLNLRTESPDFRSGTFSTSLIAWTDVSRDWGVRREPPHVNQHRTRNSPNPVRKVCPTCIKLSLIWLVTKLRRGQSRQTHCLSNGIKRFFHKLFGLVGKAISSAFTHAKNYITKY